MSTHKMFSWKNKTKKINTLSLKKIMPFLELYNIQRLFRGTVNVLIGFVDMLSDRPFKITHELHGHNFVKNVQFIGV